MNRLYSDDIFYTQTGEWCMRMILILFGSAFLVYLLTGLTGRFTKRTRLYFAIGTFVIVYLTTMFLVFSGGEP